MTIDENIANQRLAGEQAPEDGGSDAVQQVAGGPGAKSLVPLHIQGMIMPLKTPGAEGGVNASMIAVNDAGLLVTVFQYINMSTEDWIRVYWGDASTPVASVPVREADIGNNILLNVHASHIPDGISEVIYEIVRASGNREKSKPLNVLVRTVFPGGPDPEPDKDGHQRLLPAKLDLPPGTIIDEDIAKAGVKVTISGYPNMRVYDRIKLSWNGPTLVHEVSQAEVDAYSVDMLVTEDVIRAAGDGDDLVVIYQIMDEVENVQATWSMRATVDVEIGTGLFDSPLIENPDYEADPWDIIDLEKLGEEDLWLRVLADRNGLLQVGDEVALKWEGVTAQDLPLPVELEPQIVRRLPDILDFYVPNADLRRLGGGRGSASYTVTRNGTVEGASKRAAVRFHGAELGLPKPVVSEAVAGVLDPELVQATVVIPGEGLEGNDFVTLNWRGTRSDGTALLYTARRNVPSSGGGQPLTFLVTGEANIAPLNGGSVSIYYEVGRAGIDMPLKSEAESLMVGEAQFELPVPTTSPAPVDGVLDPEKLPASVDLVAEPYVNMAEGQRVTFFWQATQGDDFSSFVDINRFSSGFPVIIPLDREHIEGNVGGEVTLWYEVTEAGRPARKSAPMVFQVGQQQAPLPLPEVVEAREGVLNPSDATRGATVRIPVSANLVFGDVVRAHWQGDKPNGVTDKDESVYQENVGKPFDLIIDYQYVVANADGNVIVSYTVFGVDGSKRESGSVAVRVQSAALPVPVFVEATEGNQLNPDDVTSDATVLIDAAAHLKEHDHVLVRVISNAAGGSTTVPHTIAVGGGGREARIKVPYEVINASSGLSIRLEYQITRIAGGTVEDSPPNTYMVNRKVGSGPLLVMGARFNASTYRASSAPRMLSVFHKDTLKPMLAEWSYEGSGVWTAKTRWFDNKPWLKLLVRTETDAVELNPANIVGNGIDTTANGAAAFVAMRDDGATGSPGEVDMVAWGNAAYGGNLSPDLIATRDIAEVSCTSSAYAARRRDGYVMVWGTAGSGGTPPTDNGNYVQVRSNSHCFVGLKNDGRLFAWGAVGHGVPVAGAALDHNDFVEVCGASMAFAARRASGHVVAWGETNHGGTLKAGQDSFSDIVQLSGNYGAFAALRDPGNGGSTSVIAWGSATYGGTVSEEIARLGNVKALGAATSQAFSVLLDTNQVRAWGAASHGGNVPDNIKLLPNVVEISSTWHAFCVRLSSGNVAAWGNPTNGGSVPEDIARRSDIVQVVGSSWSFAALCRDGSVVAWGAPETGGKTSSVADKLVNVRAIYANTHGFTALTADGAVVTWGVPNGGGNSDSQQQYLTNKVTTGRTIALAEAETLAGAAGQATSV